MLLAFYMLLLCKGKFAYESIHRFEFLLVVSSTAEFNTSGVFSAVKLALQGVENLSLPFSLSYSTILDSKV